VLECLRVFGHCRLFWLGSLKNLSELEQRGNRNSDRLWPKQPGIRPTEERSGYCRLVILIVVLRFLFGGGGGLLMGRRRGWY